MRAAIWDGELEELKQSNLNGANLTGGINVYNCNDASGSSPNKRCNYVDYAAADVDGDLPAPIHLQMIPQGSSPTIPTLFLGLQWYKSSAYAGSRLVGSFTHIYELGTSNAAAAASGGSFQRLSWSGLTEQTLRVAVTAGVNTLAGLFYAPIVRLHNALASGEKLWMWWEFRYYDGSAYQKLSETSKVYVADGDNYLGLLQFGAMQLPPWGSWFLTARPVTLVVELHYQSLVNSSHQVDVDFVQLTPQQSFHVLRPLMDAPGVVEIVDNMIENRVYGIGAAGSTTGVKSQLEFAGRIELMPGVANRLIFLWCDEQSMDITWYMTVQAWYRPRRRSL